MNQLSNFLFSWQLFPELGTYEYGDRPKSGIYKIEAQAGNETIVVDTTWVSLENSAFHQHYLVHTDQNEYPLEGGDAGDSLQFIFRDLLHFEIIFYKDKEPHLHVVNQLMPDGYLRHEKKGFKEDGTPYVNVEFYYKQMSVLPYATSVSGAVIRPTEEGAIRHTALLAMEEQTNMQLNQIRRQIELLAIQAREIQSRKELSMIIYNAKLNFSPIIGQYYYLYQKKDQSHVLSIISPKEWGGGAGPFEKFLAAVKLLADHTWMEIES